MARFHWLRLRATAHATEDVERVKQAMQTVLGADAAIEEEATEGHHGAPMVILRAELKRSAEIRAAWARIAEAGAKRLAREVDPRTDDHGVFYVRLDKQEAFGGSLRVVTHDDAIQVRLKPEVHPSSREGAMAVIAEAWTV